MGDQETDQAQDTEITLSTGKLLGIFFGLAIVCGLFFTLGYMLGHASAAGGKTEIVGSVPTGGSSAGKPSATNKGDSSQNPAASTSTPAPAQTPRPGASPSPSPAQDASSTTSGSFMVQVAAVSKQEDAEILVNALRKKQYPVFIANVPGDALFHVQVGPFSDQREAEAMRSRLAGDGYNPILKK
ncbi:MAG: SPOR domain-containing protein [Acidobacteriia bacterium]|nr:SPOR domain-containing protein [Terriglobia bacterium]